MDVESTNSHGRGGSTASLRLKSSWNEEKVARSQSSEAQRAHYWQIHGGWDGLCRGVNV